MTVTIEMICPTCKRPRRIASGIKPSHFTIHFRWGLWPCRMSGQKAET